MNKDNFLGRFILSVDIKDTSVKVSKKSWELLDSWSKKLNAPIEAVHVLQYPQKKLRDKSLIVKSEIELKKYIVKSGLHQCKETTVLFGSTKARESALRLIEHSDQNDAKMIAVMTHGRKWLKRLFMGSFAETLLKLSKQPVIFLSQGTSLSKNKMIFLTDLSKESELSFRYFLDQFQKIKPEIMIYHALPPIVEFSGVMDTYPTDLKKSSMKRIDRLKDEAEKYNLRCKVFVLENILDVPGSVMKVAKNEGVSLIGIGFMGNVAKKIFMMHEKPIWVCGPEALKSRMKRKNLVIPKVSESTRKVLH